MVAENKGISSGKVGYEDIAEFSFGSVGRALVSSIIYTELFGTCCLLFILQVRARAGAEAGWGVQERGGGGGRKRGQERCVGDSHLCTHSPTPTAYPYPYHCPCSHTPMALPLPLPLPLQPKPYGLTPTPTPTPLR